MYVYVKALYCILVPISEQICFSSSVKRKKKKNPPPTTIQVTDATEYKSLTEELIHLLISSAHRACVLPEMRNRARSLRREL